MATFMILEPSIRLGHMSIFAGILAVAAALLATYLAIVVVIGSASGTPPSKWRSILKQLFVGGGTHAR